MGPWGTCDYCPFFPSARALYDMAFTSHRALPSLPDTPSRTSTEVKGNPHHHHRHIPVDPHSVQANTILVYAGLMLYDRAGNVIFWLGLAGPISHVSCTLSCRPYPV